MKRSRRSVVALLAFAAAAAQGCKSEAPAGAEPSAAPRPEPSPVASASGGGPAAASAVAKPEGPPGPLNVILLTIDSLRQDMPWTGYSRPIAPNLTKLAAESVVYTHAYAVSSYTAKSVAAFLSSRYPSSLYRSGVFFTDYPKSNLFVQEVLAEHGVRTIGLHAHKYFDRGKQLDQGFDVWKLVPGITFDAETDKNVTSDKMTDLAMEVLGDPANTGKPFFAWFHYMDPHDLYKKHEESPDFGKNNRDRYDSEVFFTDLHVGRFLEWAKKQPFWQKTAVVVSADHGEAFGEHGLFKHAFWLWDVVTRVPLIVHAPGAKPARIDMNRSHIDLAPTILDLAGVKEAPPSFVGKSLVPEIYGEPPEIRDPIVLDLPEDGHNPEVRALIRGNTKLLVYAKTRFELYDLEADPGELKNLSKERPEELAAMKAELAKVAAEKIPFVAPYGGNKLVSGRTASGQTGPLK
jgi:choline-sulfatase